MTGRIFEIKRFAVHDGDGIRTTVFFKGCPLRCVWCHNPEGLSSAPQTAFYKHKCIGCGECQKQSFLPENCLGEARVLYGKDVDIESLLALLLEDRDFYIHSGGGVTLSGGECLLQADFCAALLQKLHKQGIHTAIDTCGFVPREALDKVAPFTDIFLYDIKAFDEDVHIRCTGHSNRLILENLQHLNTLEKSIEIRIPYVPDLNDTQIEKIAHFLAPLTHITKIRVLPYHDLAASKYEALQIPHALPKRVPTAQELQAAGACIKSITGFTVLA